MTYKVLIFSSPGGVAMFGFPGVTSEVLLIALAETLMQSYGVYKVQIECNGKLIHEEI